MLSESIAELAQEAIPLAPNCRYSIPRALKYENISQYNTEFATHMSRDVYGARDVEIDRIVLARIGSINVFPNLEFTSTSNGAVIKEQFLSSLVPEERLSAIEHIAPHEIIEKETVIIARFGVWTWGHWLGELLPKVVMTEAACPGRFLYAIPKFYFEPRWKTFLQSLLAYGIPIERLTPLQHDVVYQFRNGWLVTPVWSDFLMHPTAAEMMRCRLGSHTFLPTCQKIALTRRDQDDRGLQNWNELAPILMARGFKVVDIAELDFAAQRTAFANADFVFSTLGSGLTGVIFAPSGVGVASVAPHLFGDRFFYALTVDRRGGFADIRGEIVTPHPSVPHRSSFRIEPESLEAGLSSLNC